MTSIRTLLIILFCWCCPVSVLGFQDYEGANIIGNTGDGTNAVVGSDGLDQLVMAEKEQTQEVTSSRVRRAADYEVTGVSARQDGETRIISWFHATGPFPVAQYNIYRIFTTAVSFNVSRLEPIATVSSNDARLWRDACRTEEHLVRYAVTAVDVTGTEHTTHVVPSQTLLLVGSFVPSMSLKYPLANTSDCCVLWHDLVFNWDNNEFLLAYDCDNDSDGDGDDVFAVRLDYSGSSKELPRSIRAKVSGLATQGHPSVAYNPHYKEYLVSFHIKTQSVNANRQSIMTQVIPAENTKPIIDNPRLSVIGTDSNGRAVDLRKTTVIYNPVSHGYVLASELTSQTHVQIITAFLSKDGSLQSGRPVFDYGVDVLQPNVVYEPLSQTVVFVSQLDSSNTALKTKENILITKSLPASGTFSGNYSATAITFTHLYYSSISVHRDSTTNCLRVCFNDEDDSGQIQPTCSTLCNTGSQRWTVRHTDVSFCTCKNTVLNPKIIEYPVNGQVFGVWEELSGISHHLHGYYVSAQQFVQDPVSDVQKHPIPVYKSSNGQVCVAWQHHSGLKTCSKLAIRCYKHSETCNDFCCCQGEKINHCNACGSTLLCDSNAECTPEKHCKCRVTLGFSGNGLSCALDPCAPGSQTCKATEDCISNGTTFTCVCKTKYKSVGDSCINPDPCAPGAHDCNAHAYCQRKGDSSYTCHCYRGYIGNGKICKSCHKDASSQDNKCVCNRGFVGNGVFCCLKKFGDVLVGIGDSIAISFDPACLGSYRRLARFDWFHRDSITPIVTSGKSQYALRRSGTKLVVTDITKKQLGRYMVRLFVDTYGPYEMTARIDSFPKTGKCTCGLSGRKDARIATGGKTAKVGEFPWQAMLCATNGTFCGGVMISKCCILTAAHCVSGSHGRSQFDISNSKSLTVCLGRRCGDCKVGYFKSSRERNDERAQCFKANRIDVHREYNETLFEHDIAMIQLKRRNCIKCRAANARPICLPQSSRDSARIASGNKATVTGWGEIQVGKGGTGCLRKGHTTLISRERCRKHYAALTPPQVITSDQICAEDAAGPCQGDGGGPLIVKKTEFENRFVLAGLVSWGIGCGLANSFGVYTDIQQHLDWIYKTCQDWNKNGN